MNAALPFAEEMLATYGEFLPYGQAMAEDGKIVAVGATDGREHPPSKDLIQILKDGFKAGAREGKYKATAIVYDIWIALPGTDMKSDAIAVSLNHRGGYSALVFFPYQLEGQQVVMGDVFAQEEENYVFGP
jgi:hypothetical protein